MCNFLLAMTLKLEEISTLHLQISVPSISCTGNATMSVTEKLKTLNILTIFLSTNSAGTPCSQVATFSVRWQCSNF